MGTFAVLSRCAAGGFLEFLDKEGYIFKAAGRGGLQHGSALEQLHLGMTDPQGGEVADGGGTGVLFEIGAEIFRTHSRTGGDAVQGQLLEIIGTHIVQSLVQRRGGGLRSRLQQPLLLAQRQENQQLGCDQRRVFLTIGTKLRDLPEQGDQLRVGALRREAQFAAVKWGEQLLADQTFRGQLQQPTGQHQAIIPGRGLIYIHSVDLAGADEIQLPRAGAQHISVQKDAGASFQAEQDLQIVVVVQGRDAGVGQGAFLSDKIQRKFRRSPGDLFNGSFHTASM